MKGGEVVECQDIGFEAYGEQCCVAGCTFDRPLVSCIRDSLAVRALCLIW